MSKKTEESEIDTIDIPAPGNGSSLARYEKPAADLMLTPVFNLEVAKKRMQELQAFVKDYLIDGEDFGTIPGTPKPTLYKSGADKLCDIYGIADTYKVTNRVEDWEKLLFDYEVECTLSSKRTGGLIATGLGSCNSYETKYRYRDQKRSCPKCGKLTIIKGKEEFGGGYICWKKEGRSDGCGAKFSENDTAITAQQIGRVQNEDVADIKNTLIKMAKKRCLGSNTPVLVSTKCGPSRVRMDTVYQMWINKGHGPVKIPVPGGWADIRDFVREERTHSVRIDLSDGTHIQCSGEHVFPTLRGELPVAEIKVGDSLVRETIKLETENIGRVDPEIGWVVGFFLAEGHFDRTGLKFTMHAGETEEALRVIRLAESLGCSCDFQPRPKGNAADLTVAGPAFIGLMRQFISGDDCYGKHLSKYAWRQGEFFLGAILTGYLSGDGHKILGRRQDKWILGFTGKNFALADDLRCLAACLGFRINLKPGTSMSLGRIFRTYTGWISKDEPKYNGKNLSEVTRISVENRRSVLYDLEVDAPHLFLLPTGIVSHNSKVDAVLSATRSSGLFSQDIEDWGKVEEGEDKKQAPATPQQQAPQPPKTNQPPVVSAPPKTAEPPKRGRPPAAKPPAAAPVAVPKAEIPVNEPMNPPLAPPPVEPSKKTNGERLKKIVERTGTSTQLVLAFIARHLGCKDNEIQGRKRTEIEGTLTALEQTIGGFEPAAVGAFIKGESTPALVSAFFLNTYADTQKQG